MDSTSDLIIDSLKEEPIGETDHFVWFITDIGIVALFKREADFETYSLNAEFEANKIALAAIAFGFCSVKKESKLFNKCVAEIIEDGGTNSEAVSYCNGGN